MSTVSIQGEFRFEKAAEALDYASSRKLPGAAPAKLENVVSFLTPELITAAGAIWRPLRPKGKLNRVMQMRVH